MTAQAGRRIPPFMAVALRSTEAGAVTAGHLIVAATLLVVFLFVVELLEVLAAVQTL